MTSIRPAGEKKQYWISVITKSVFNILLFIILNIYCLSSFLYYTFLQNLSMVYYISPVLPLGDALPGSYRDSCPTGSTAWPIGAIIPPDVMAGIRLLKHHIKH